MNVRARGRGGGVLHFDGAERHREAGVVLVGEAAVARAGLGVGTALGEFGVDMGEMEENVRVVGVHLAQTVEGGGGLFPVAVLLVAHGDRHKVQRGGKMHVGGGLAHHSGLRLGEPGEGFIAQPAH